MSMKAWNVTPEDLEDAAGHACVKVEHLRPSGSGYNFVIRRRTQMWTRLGRYKNHDGSQRKIPGAVCWHGHYEFMLELFTLKPDARIRTSMAYYRGREDFLEKAQTTFAKLGHSSRDCTCFENDQT